MKRATMKPWRPHAARMSQVEARRLAERGRLPGAGEAASFHAIQRESGYSLDLHPDGLRLAVASYQTVGQGGNGRGRPERP